MMDAYAERLMQLAQTIKALRLERSMTQQVLADSAGISRTQITNIERGRVATSLQTLFGIADALEIEVSELFIVTQRGIKCPTCRNPIDVKLIICPYCGGDL